MGQIKITKSAVVNEGKKMCNNSRQIEALNKRLVAALDGLSNAWVGEDSKKFIAQMKSIYVPSLELVQLRMDAYGKFLQGVRGPYNSLDAAYGRKKVGK